MLFKKRSSQDKILKSTIRGIIGRNPSNLDLYKLSLAHSSSEGDSNERLEYLGDAILGAVVADFLFKTFPSKNEGFLTEIRSRIVKRESLNGLAGKIGISNLVQHSNKNIKSRTSSVFGNALEAFIGAIYLDQGYHFCYGYIIDNLVNPHIDLKELIHSNHNFKSILIEWSQKEGKQVHFDIVNETGNNHQKTFHAVIKIDQKEIGSATGYSKKKAEQAAAQNCCENLNLI